jgi:hypothetical protein
MWAEGIDSHIMASAMATKTRLDAEADAQNIWLKTLGEIQNMKSKALRDIRYHEEDLKKGSGSHGQILTWWHHSCSIPGIILPS